MKKQLLFIVCSICCMHVSTATAQTSHLENAFVAISKISGFQTYTKQQIIDEWEMSEDNIMIYEELGEVIMAFYGNADPREQFLAITGAIPKSMLYKERKQDGERHITRFYTETDAHGTGYLLYTCVGRGPNDTVAMLYKGRSEAFYKNVLDGDTYRWY